MKKMMKKGIGKKWQSSYSLLLKIIVASIILTLLSDYESLLQTKQYYVLLLIWWLIFLISVWGTYVATKENKLIDVGRHCPFLKHEVRIDQISKIARVQAFIFKNWGSYFAIYTADGSGKQEFALDIRENNYSAENVKGILRYILEKNPTVEIDPQYQELLDGKIEDEFWFSRKPATHKTYDTVL